MQLEEFSKINEKSILQIDTDTGEILGSIQRSDYEAVRRERYRQQTFAAQLLDDSRLTYCHVGVGHGQSCVRVNVDASRQKRSFGGLAVCASIAKCPVCAARILQQRANEIRKVMNWAVDQGYHCTFLTITVKHGFDERFADVIGRLRDGWQSVTTRNEYKSKKKGLKGDIGWLGDITAIEATHGKSGWHPHYHKIVISERPIKKIHQARLIRWYRGYFQRNNLPVPSIRHGFTFQDGSKAGEYLTKMGSDGQYKETMNGQRVKWDVADEVTGQNRKVGRIEGNRTTIQILMDAQEASNGLKLQMYGKATPTELRRIVMRDTMLFRDYVEGMAGYAPIRFSRGLKSLAGVTEKSDELLASREHGSVVEYAIPTPYWRPLLKEYRRTRILEIIENQGFNGLCSIVASANKISFDQVKQDIEEETVNYIAAITQKARDKRELQEAGRMDSAGGFAGGDFSFGDMDVDRDEGFVSVTHETLDVQGRAKTKASRVSETHIEKVKAEEQLLVAENVNDDLTSIIDVIFDQQKQAIDEAAREAHSATIDQLMAKIPAPK